MVYINHWDSHMEFFFPLLIVFFYVEKNFTGLALLAIPPKLILSYSKVERSDSVWLLSLEG